MKSTRLIKFKSLKMQKKISAMHGTPPSKLFNRTGKATTGRSAIAATVSVAKTKNANTSYDAESMSINDTIENGSVVGKGLHCSSPNFSR